MEPNILWQKQSLQFAQLSIRKVDMLVLVMTGS
jgi:hypothetical protein